MLVPVADFCGLLRGGHIVSVSTSIAVDGVLDLSVLGVSTDPGFGAGWMWIGAGGERCRLGVDVGDWA